MAIHVAILKRPYLALILRGCKTVESRLTKTSRPPYGCLAPGERLFFKASAGPFMATAIAGRVRAFIDLTPARVDQLRQQYQQTVGGDDAYWHGKRDSRFATFVELTQVEPLDVGPAYPKVNMRAWHVLDDDASPLREVTVTAGALRNGYMLFPAEQQPGRDAAIPLELVLPDGEKVTTEMVRGRMLRWRGWRRYYAEHEVRAGDTVRFVAMKPGRYVVSFHPAAR